MTPAQLEAFRAILDDPEDHEWADILDAGRKLLTAYDSLRGEVERLRGLLSVSALFTEPNYTKRYDDLAERFYQETGVMAPGKSVALEMANSQPPDHERGARYRAWLDALRTKLYDAAERFLNERPQEEP